MLKLGVLASGRGSNLQAIIEAIERGALDATIEVIISNKVDAKALNLAKDHNLKGMFLDPQSVRDEANPKIAYDKNILTVLQEHDVEVLVLAGYMKIVTPLLIQAYPNRIMNIHPSLLPAFPGLHVQEKALAWGVKVSGCTVHFVSEGVDEGPIILQAAVPISDTDTSETLAARILEQEHKIYPHAIQIFAEKRLTIEGRKVHIAEGKRE